MDRKAQYCTNDIYSQVDPNAQFSCNKNPNGDLFILNCLFSFMFKILCVYACSS